MSREVWWYRLPVESDDRNWRWVTLDAVMAGRVPAARWEVLAAGRNPVDFTLSNVGEADGPLPVRITVDWPGHQPSASDAVGHWTVAIPHRGESVAPSRVEFRLSPTASSRPLAPGSRSAVGWLRYHEDLPSPQILQIRLDR